MFHNMLRRQPQVDREYENKVIPVHRPGAALRIQPRAALPAYLEA
jgi:hypothetical protein